MQEKVIVFLILVLKILRSDILLTFLRKIVQTLGGVRSQKSKNKIRTSEKNLFILKIQKNGNKEKLNINFK